MQFRAEQSKSQRVLDAIREDIVSGRLKPRDRLRSMRQLAETFDVSLKSVQSALASLAEEGLVERRHGSGTFVADYPAVGAEPIFFLVPNASHITSNHETAVVMRRLQYGATLAASAGQLVQLLPLSRHDVASLRQEPQAVDWAALEQIPSGARVFVCGTWFGPVISHLVGRDVQGVFLATQYECQYPDVWKLVQAANWSIMTVDRRAAIRRAIEYLYHQGRRRIGVIKRCKDEPEHPFRRGFEEACDSLEGLLPALFREFSASRSVHEVAELVVDLHEEEGIDALVVCDPHVVATVLDVLGDRLGLSVPDDVAVLAHRDLPCFVEATPSVSAFDFPWVDIGREIVRVCNAPHAQGRHTIFQATIIERTSTGGATHGTASPELIPELIGNAGLQALSV